MPRDLTVIDEQNNGWSVRFLDRKEWVAFKRDQKFGTRALKAQKLKKNWPDSRIFEGALAYVESRVHHLTPADQANWLSLRGLKEVRL